MRGGTRNSVMITLPFKLTTMSTPTSSSLASLSTSPDIQELQPAHYFCLSKDKHIKGRAVPCSRTSLGPTSGLCESLHVVKSYICTG
ncbi:hypothetical protein D9757_012875 [Collybiopsis confluens]|uniref:Uncharacterized protein n=1 Tax=Collybiopsis confluens TaxID=2823264 RepID=A0A8H5D1P8_9AGAR|nr:hypothetical protein D9757_012875 [Collybiopsis confluens]